MKILGKKLKITFILAMLFMLSFASNAHAGTTWYVTIRVTGIYVSDTTDGSVNNGAEVFYKFGSSRIPYSSGDLGSYTGANGVTWVPPVKGKYHSNTALDKSMGYQISAGFSKEIGMYDADGSSEQMMLRVKLTTTSLTAGNWEFDTKRSSFNEGPIRIDYLDSQDNTRGYWSTCQGVECWAIDGYYTAFAFSITIYSVTLPPGMG